ncbi:RNA SPLICING PROTEIN MRS2 MITOCHONDRIAL [Salix purpurea]|uniref:RNA SPLICING PROTEIN MRS2 MITOCHONDRIAL n=1 Tax=Salix purpurea TaxID=77065 RepID=A0A9Q0PQV0_SALPP|nr:RNA SPLICING PROTEIN MRS2 MITOCHONDRIAL [Salix purpurea]
MRESRPKGNRVSRIEMDQRFFHMSFVALETCLEAACSCLESEAKTLEQEARPALDKLTSKISTLNLEQKLVQQQLDDSSTSSLNEGNDIDDDELQADSNDSIPAEVSLGALPSHKDDINNIDNEHDHQFTAPNGPGRYSNTHTSTTRSAISKNLNVGELEMLLEAYFVQIDGTLNKLSTLGEYVDDTEDYINIMLDDKQNQLLQMGVMMTTTTLVVTFFVVVVGIFGMNIKIALFKEDVQTGMPKFLWIVAGGTSGVIFLYVIAIAWCKHKRLLDN